ncbi:MAG: hypothetical protein HRU19_26950 [Pseudobacteriovorax sp.]|nr:hypothetical protein [Pseudobacteriovorax sp.]
MTRNLKLGAVGLFILSQGVGCGSSDDDSGGGAASSTYYAYSRLNITQNFEAATPKGFKPAASTGLLYEDNRETKCLKAGVRDSLEYEICKLSYEVRQRFFQPSGKSINENLDSFEGGMNANLYRAGGGYIPCLDPNYTSGSNVIFSDATEGEAVAYNETNVSYAIPDGGSGIATGLDLTFSCGYGGVDGNNNNNAQAFGKSGSVWSLVFDNDAGRTSIGTLSEDGSIDLWFGYGNRTVDGPEDEVVDDSTDTPYIFDGGATIANIKVLPDQGLVAMAVVGEYGGECGTRMVMNQSALYLKADINRYGACFEGDVYDQYVLDNNINEDNTGLFRAEWENAELCLVVSDSLPQISDAGLQHCIDAGLVTYAEDGTTIADPFTAIDLPNLSAKGDRAPAGAQKVRGWMAGQFHQGFDLSAVPAFGWELINEGQTFAQVEGYEVSSYAFSLPDSVNSEPIKVKAACNADATTRTAEFSQTYQLTVAEIIANSGSDDDVVTKTVNALNGAMLAVDDAAPTFNVNIGGVVGVTHRSLISGSVTLAADGTTIGSGTYEGTTEGTSNVAEVSVALSDVPTLSQTSTLSVTIAGSLELSCNSATAQERTAAATIGMPMLVYYAVPQN